MFARLTTLTLLAAVAGPGAAATYVVSPTGDDAAAGTAAAPWRTMQHAADRAAPGDRVELQTGIYRERVMITRSGEPGQPITYAAAPGGRPEIWFSKSQGEAADWAAAGPQRWRTLPGSFGREVNFDVATIWHDDQSRWRSKKRSPAELRERWDFHHDVANGWLEVWAEANPATLADRIEIPLDPPDANQFIVTCRASWIVFDGLGIKYANVHGMQVMGDHVTFRNGAITHGGGGNIGPHRSPPVRWGDGLDIWKSAHDVLFEDNVVGEFPDGGLTNQGFDGIQERITFRNNLIFNCTNGIHCWFGGQEGQGAKVLRDIVYEGNTFRDIGRGWFADQGVMQGAIQFSPRRDVTCERVSIRNNTFERCGTTRFTGGDWRGVNGAINVGGGEVFIEGNVIRDGPSDGIHINGFHQPFRGRIARNIIFANAWCGLRLWANVAAADVVIEQNTIVDNGDAEHPNAVAEHPRSAAVWRRNLLCSDRSKPVVCASGRFEQNVIWPGPANQAADIAADPRFVNRAAGDLRLRPDSPCAWAGAFAPEP